MPRKATKYQGVYVRESSKRRWRGRPDCCFTIDYYDSTGKRIRKDVGWASEGYTAALANEIRIKAMAGEKLEKAKPGLNAIPAMTLGDAWERYRVDWLEAKGKRVSSDAAMFNRYIGHMLGMRLDAITPIVLDRLMASLGEQGLSSQTVRYLIAMIRRVMRRMVRWGLYDGPMPFDAITLPKVNNARQRYLTPAEAKALLDALKKRSTSVWCMALISLHCGLRFGEVAALHLGDCNFGDGTIFVRESKSGLARHAVMTQEVAEAIIALGVRGHDSLLFPDRSGRVRLSPSDTFARVVDQIGLNADVADRRQKVVFHTLRHTYASWLACAGEGELSLAELLGHRSTEMTKRYAHLMRGARRASAEKISAVFHSESPNNL